MTWRDESRINDGWAMRRAVLYRTIFCPIRRARKGGFALRPKELVWSPRVTGIFSHEN